MNYVSTIEIEGSSIQSITYKAENTEAESVAAAIAAYAKDGHSAESLMSIKTVAYDDDETEGYYGA